MHRSYIPKPATKSFGVDLIFLGYFRFNNIVGYKASDTLVQFDSVLVR